MFILDFFVGLFALIITTIYLTSGLRITFRYRKERKLVFITLGLCWVIIPSPWIASSTSFILFLLTGEGLSFPIYVFIGTFLYPIASVFWIYSWGVLMDFSKQVINFMVIGLFLGEIIYFLFFIYFLVVDPSFLGRLTLITDAQYSLFIIIYHLFTLIFLFLTSISFYRLTLTSDNIIIRFKGKIFLISIGFFGIGALGDIFSSIHIYDFPLIMIISLFALIASSILFSITFLLPKRLERFLGRFAK